MFRIADVNGCRERYSQCEKEALAVVWGPERFWLYVVGRPFVLVTDNRAVQLIFSNTKSKPPPRTERLALRMSQFWYTIVHRPGTSNIADYYSRNPCKAQPSAFLEELKAENYINMVVAQAIPKALTVKEVEAATASDKLLQTLKQWLTTDTKRPFPVGLEGFKHVRDDLSCTKGGIVLRGNRIVIPASLQTRVVDLAHGGHQGIVKTKALIRSRVWFAGIDAKVEHAVKVCAQC